MGKKKTTEREHALLSASSAHKWLWCTPSARLEDELPDSTSDAAKEGTLAHSICELKLAKLFTDQNMTTRTYNGRMEKLKKDTLYQMEMERYTDEYVDYIKELAFSMPSPPFVAIEKKLDYGAWAPEGFGTGDCIMLQGNTMHIIDFKYGKGVPVFAEGNSQLALYALGALDEFGFLYPIEKIVLHIIQPRLHSFTKWETSTKEITAWGEAVVKPKAQLAFDGKGEFVEGKYCDSCFCKLSGTCRKRAENNLALMDQAMDPITGKTVDPPTLSNEEVGAILKKAQFLKKWAEKLEKYARDTLVSGGEIPGWKLIEGRSNRAFSSEAEVVQALTESGFEEALLYERKLLPLTAIEKIVDKETWNNVVGAYIVKPEGAPTLAPADDKRPELKLKASPEEAFGGENQYKEDTSCQLPQEK